MDVARNFSVVVVELRPIFTLVHQLDLGQLLLLYGSLVVHYNLHHVVFDVVVSHFGLLHTLDLTIVLFAASGR